MNIFKVLASGKKSFQEEQASAVIAWLMNPRMEHGLGFLFLSRFINELQKSQTKLEEISGKLINQLRSDSNSELKWSCKLEYNVEIAFVDIAFYLDDWIIAIENKIYADSASDEMQLVREYQGIRKKDPDKKIGIIFLVPYTSQDGELLNDKVQKEYDALPDELGEDCFKQLITWQRNSMGYPSISAIIESILEDEAKGLVEPIPEYTRHTLKALNMFIINEFEGYYYDGSNRYSGNNARTEENLTVDELRKRTIGFVGVQGGLSGLILMEKAKLQKHAFQYTTTDMSTSRNWLTIDMFQKLVSWVLNGKDPEIKWDVVLPARALYKITRDFPTAKVFIGIRGGLKAFEAMSPQEIEGKRWGIKAVDQQPTSQWIDGATFREIIEKKGVFTS